MNFRGLLTVFFSLLLLNSLANANEEVVLTARPGLCIIKDSDTSDCIMGVDLQWQAGGGENLCLYRSDRDQALACWQQVDTGKYHDELVSQQDIRYWLQRADDDTALATITVRVVSLAKRGPQRRRRRHPWSVL